jgi:hypothetical protein
MSFSASEAAFAGFRIFTRRPGAFVVWALMFLVFLAGLAGLVALFLWPILSFVIQHPHEPYAPEPGDMMRVVLMYPFVLVLALAFSSMFVGAIYRTVLRPKETSAASLRFGGDELRLIGVWFVLSLLWLAVVGALAGVGAALVFAVQGVVWKVFAGLVYGLAAAALLVVLAVRLSLAAPMTFAERRFRLFESWSLTRGRFFELLGMWLLAWLVSYGVSFLGAIVAEAFIIGGVLMTGHREWTSAPDTAALTAMAPFLVIGLVLYVLVATLQLVVRVAPGAEAYRALVPGPDQADAFS